MTEETTLSAEGAFRPSRRAVVRTAAWSVPVVTVAATVPFAAATTDVERTIQWLNAAFEPTDAYSQNDCEPFDATVQVRDDDEPAPAGTLVTVTLPAGVTWSDGTTGPKQVALDALGRHTLTGLRLKDAAPFVTLNATVDNLPTGSGVVNALAVVQAGGDALWSTFRGRSNNIESQLPRSVVSIQDFAIAWTGEGTTVETSTYTSYAVDQAGTVWARTQFSGVQSSSPLVTWDEVNGRTWDAVSGRAGTIRVATDDSPVRAGVGPTALFSSDGNLVYDFVGAALPALPDGRGVADLAVGYVHTPGQWTVTVVASNGTAWHITSTSSDATSVSWPTDWTQYAAISGAKNVAMDTTTGTTVRTVFATDTQILNPDGSLIADVPAGVEIRDLAVEINRANYNIIGTDNVYRRFNWNDTQWHTEPGVTRTSVASSSTTQAVSHAFNTLGTSVCPAL
ncbi:MAG TPA: hypothetical protein PKE40_14170 [Arachnia sp.]|nr:hypothetical protein [Arachnia sp.]HMT87489.1 hypothetical protein [Arachnia sp.]